MVIIRITMNVIPSKQMEMMQTLISMREPAGNQAGCMSYGFFCDIKDKNRFFLLAEWETREYLDRHIASHRFGVLLGTKALLREPLKIQIHTVSHSEGIDAVRAARGKDAGISPTAEQGRRIV